MTRVASPPDRDPAPLGRSNVRPMDDSSRHDSDQAQATTRWLLVVLVATAVLAGAVIVVTDVPGLVGNRWQLVGLLSVGATLLALVVGLLVVLRALEAWPNAMSPAFDEAGDREVAGGDAGEVPAEEDGGDDAPDMTADGTSDETGEAVVDDAVAVTDDSTDDSAGDTAGDTTGVPTARLDEVTIGGENGGVAARRSRRRLVQRYRTARLGTAAAVLVALGGMAGMIIASVQDGDNVEARARLAAENRDGPVSAPITEPLAVAIELTPLGRVAMAEALGCSRGKLGPAPLQGWAVAGALDEPTVVVLSPDPACTNARVELDARLGFVYPTILAPPESATTTTTVQTGPPPAPVPAAPGAVPPAG